MVDVCSCWGPLFLFLKDLDIAFQPVEDAKWLASGSRGAAEAVELRDCFQLFISPERLEENNLWFCPDCKDFKAALKKLDLWRLPKYMFVQLKRFQYSRFYREKLSTKVRFPREYVEKSPVVALISTHSWSDSHSVGH